MTENFQDGCDTIVAGCTTYGATPTSNSPTDIVNAIKKIYTDRYNTGHSVGYNSGYSAGKSAGSLSGTFTIKHTAKIQRKSGSNSSSSSESVVTVSNGVVTNITNTSASKSMSVSGEDRLTAYSTLSY